MYDGAISVDEVLKRLTDMKAENASLASDATAYLVRAILDEIKLLQSYSDQDRKLTAALLGGVIRQNLIPFRDLKLEAMSCLLVSPWSASRCVLHHVVTTNDVVSTWTMCNPLAC